MVKNVEMMDVVVAVVTVNLYLPVIVLKTILP
jgi:hypothetical protein